MASDSESKSDKLLEQIEQLTQNLKDSLEQVKLPDEIQDLKVEYLGRKSKLTNILKGLKDLSDEGKKQVGQQANTAKEKMTSLINKQERKLKQEVFKQQISQEKIDVTLPGKKHELGHKHPVTAMQQRAEDIFLSMGFQIAYPYEIDSDYNIFEALNFPKDHPARDSWDTFIAEDGQMPIPHTSAMQNRVLSNNEPPIRYIVPGRTFRNEATDARHEHTFFQIEGIYVDKGIALSDMLGTLKTFFSEFYEKDIKVKFTPDYFPFVEPGGMMSLTCILCDAKGCNVCKQTGWLEILGCGMIHPNVLSEAGIDPNVYSGFAWGFGLERLIMLKFGIEDIRHFNSGNLKFIRQF